MRKWSGISTLRPLTTTSAFGSVRARRCRPEVQPAAVRNPRIGLTYLTTRFSRVARTQRARLWMHAPTGLSELDWPPADARCRKLTPYRRRWRLELRSDALRQGVVWCLLSTVDRRQVPVPAFRCTRCEFFTNAHAAASASTADTRAPAACSTRTDSRAVAPVVTMSSTSSSSPSAGRQRRRRQHYPAGDIAFARGAVQPGRVAGPRLHP